MEQQQVQIPGLVDPYYLIALVRPGEETDDYYYAALYDSDKPLVLHVTDGKARLDTEVLTWAEAVREAEWLVAESGFSADVTDPAAMPGLIRLADVRRRIFLDHKKDRRLRWCSFL